MCTFIHVTPSNTLIPTHIHIYTLAHIHTCTHAHCTHACIHIFTHKRACAHICIHTNTCRHKHSQISVHAHTYICTYGYIGALSTTETRATRVRGHSLSGANLYRRTLKWAPHLPYPTSLTQVFRVGSAALCSPREPELNHV